MLWAIYYFFLRESEFYFISKSIFKMIDFIIAVSFTSDLDLDLDSCSGCLLVDPKIANPNKAISIKITTAMIEITYNTINDILTQLKAPLFSSPIFDLRDRLLSDFY
jgi:hypothetical protein